MWRLVGWIIPGFGRVSKIQLKITVSTMSSSFKMLWVWLFLLKFQWQRKNQIETAAAMSLQSCPTLCDPIDGSPPGSPVPGILQAKTLEWVAISFSNAWKWKVKVKSLSRVWLLATPWTAPSMGFSRQKYWSGLPLPSPMHESEKWKWSRSSHFWLLATPWTAAYQAPLSIGFSRQEYWSGVPLPSPSNQEFRNTNQCKILLPQLALREGDGRKLGLRHVTKHWSLRLDYKEQLLLYI